jgi:uncharacterized protein YbaR (Trm112 family)
MNIELLEILRCPFCGARLELVSSMFHRSISDQIHDGILGCDCCIFPVVDGIPVLHLQPPAVQAREHVEAGRPELALRAMVGLESDEEAERFEAAASSNSSTYREIVEALPDASIGRVFILFPLVVAVGWSISRGKMMEGVEKVPVPVFALGFLIVVIMWIKLALQVFNSAFRPLAI